MEIEFVKKKVIECYLALEKAGETNVEFDNYHIVHDLSLNKKALESHFEALRLMDRPCPEYVKYQKEVNTLRSNLANDQKALKAAFDELNNKAETRLAIEKENARLEKWSEELDKKVVIKNIKRIKRYNDQGEPTIRGNSSAVLAFIQKIDPMFEPVLNNETPVKTEEKKLGKTK
jgi:hypothetical protein